MGEIESELDSVLNQYHDKQEHIRESQRREQDEHRVSENEFKKLFSNIVEPSMMQMVKYLESKGDDFKGSYMKISPHLAKITLIINAYRYQEGSHWAEIEFSREGDKLKIRKNENEAITEALFVKSDLNPRFVKRILIDFVKSYYKTTDFQLSDRSKVKILKECN